MGDYYSSGEYYIVRSGIISIQGRYLPTKFTNGLAVTKMVAIGGPLLKGNKLIIGPLLPHGTEHPFWAAFLHTLTSQVLCTWIMTMWALLWTLLWMHQKRRLCTSKFLTAHRRGSWSRSTGGRHQRGMSTSIGRSQCTRALVRMGTAVTSMATQLMTIGWQSGNVLAHKVSPPPRVAVCNKDARHSCQQA